MSRPLNPQTSASAAADTSRKTGVNAAASSVNALVVPLSHVTGRIVPIYNMRPTAHQTNEDSSVTIGSWDLPFYPTHGLWRDDDEDDLNGAGASWFIGPATEQFGPSYTATFLGHLRHPSALADNVAEAVEVDAISEWDNLSTTATETEALRVPLIARRTPRPDPGDVLDVHAIAELYADVGMYNLPPRDRISAAFLRARPVSPTALVSTSTTPPSTASTPTRPTRPPTRATATRSSLASTRSRSSSAVQPRRAGRC